ncbi:hypothetical protein DWW36_07225 [Erysipelotrichaceae bacterium AF15-26LB]|nr:hypothetical protein DWW36_07225 [Erysipelotrichaceae bacterium AF15-26LB]RJV93318.1 hypothetical protein DWX45_00385 [Erysipelotrichaceae bacterium AF19-24AC]
MHRISNSSVYKKISAGNNSVQQHLNGSISKGYKLSLKCRFFPYIMERGRTLKRYCFFFATGKAVV